MNQLLSNRRHVLTLLLCSSGFAKGKKTAHPAGFSFELPDKWKWEFAERGGVLLPPGVIVDPEKEDNPEIYSFRLPASESNAAERNYVDDLKAELKGSKISPDRGGDIENFSEPGLGGVIYTFDFLHPRQKVPYRIRVFAMSAKGKLLFLIANGHRAKIETRDRVLREIARSIAWR